MAEITLEPTPLSKVIPISLKVNETDAKEVTRLATKKQFNTTDTDAWLSFTLEGLETTSGELDLTLINVDENPSSIFHHTSIAFHGIPFNYKLDASEDLTKNEIRHAGRWIGQVIIRLANGDTTTRQFDFAIAGHLLDGKEARVILIEDYNALMATIAESKGTLDQYNIDYAALLTDITEAETLRTQSYNQLLANQQANIEAFDVALDEGIVAANLATKLQTFEATNNSRLLSAEQQLAETSNRIDDIITTPVPTGEIIGQEIVDARQGELSLGANISEVKSQLAQTAQSVHQMGENVKASVFGGDFTTKFEDVPKIDGAYITPSEVTITVAGWCYGFVDISNDQISKLIVTLTELSDTAVLHFADKDKNLLQNIGGWVTSGTYEYTSIPTGTKYLCVSSKLEDVSKISVEVQQIGGGIYEEITDKLIEQSEEIKTYVKQSVFKEGLDTIEFADIEITKGYFISAFGVKVADASYCYGYVPVADAILYTANLENVIPGSVIISNARIDKSHIIYFMNWMSSGTYTNYLDYNSIVKYAVISCKIKDIEKISLNIRKKSYEAEISGNRQDAIRNGAAYAHTRIPHEKFIKGLHLDAGRKYFNLANIKTLIDNAQAAGLNTFQLYFSDNNGFRFGLNDMSINVYGDVYDLSIALGDGVAPTDGTDKWLTQAEMDEIITYANSKGIEVIPAFDMPGHFGAIELAFPDSKFDVTKEYGIEFSIEILKKYANYFASRGCRYYNICGDEVVMTVEQYEAFMGRALNEIVRANMIPMFYNDMVCVAGYNKPAMNNGGIVLGWIRRPGEHAPYEDIVKAGYRMLNAASSNYYYWTLGLHTTTPELVENIRNSDIFMMADYKINRNITGVMYHIWTDGADVDGPDEGDNVVAQTAACIEAFGEAVNRQVPGDYVPEEKIQTSSDFESLGNGSGVILKSPDGTTYKIYVNDSGVLTTESL